MQSKSTLNPIKSGLAFAEAYNPVNGLGRAAIVDAKIKLDEVTPLASWSVSEAAAVTDALAGAQQKLGELLGVGGWRSAVHPYSYSVGRGTKYDRHLAAPNAVAALIDKLEDWRDTQKPSGSLDAFMVLITAPDFNSWLNKLSAFNAVLPIPEFTLAERRALQISAHDKNKWQRPEPLNEPDWVLINNTQELRNQHLHKVVGDPIAMLAAADAENTSPIAELKEFLDIKTQAIDAMQTRYSEFVSIFGAGGFYAGGVKGSSPSDVASKLRSMGGPGLDSVYTAAVLWVAPIDTLGFVQEVFQ